MSDHARSESGKLRRMTFGFLLGLMALIGLAYGVLAGITLATVIITDLADTLYYRLVLTAAGTFGGIIGAACNVSLGLVLYGFVLTTRQMLRSRRTTESEGGQ
jgi:hypothetical protein